MFATDVTPRAPHAWPWSYHGPHPPRLARLHALDHEATPPPSHAHQHYHHTHFYEEPNDSASSTSPLRRPRRQPKKNISRERMRSELLALRVQASCLETELAYLQQLAQERDAAGQGIALDDSELIRNNCNPPTSACGWRSVAERQRTRRLRAEMQNHRLRSFVETQRSEWQSLQMLFDDKSQVLVSKIASVQGVEVRRTVAAPSAKIGWSRGARSNSISPC